MPEPLRHFLKPSLQFQFINEGADPPEAKRVGQMPRILASAPHTRTVGNGTFILAVVQKGVADAIYSATGGQVAIDDFRGQLGFIRADLAGGASLLVPSGSKPRSGRLTLVTEAMAYSLAPFDTADGPTWQMAFCGGAQAKGGFVGFRQPLRW
jgi:hypothetical protein